MTETTSKAAHTPGPWRLRRDHSSTAYSLICDVHRVRFADLDTMNPANAHLIAAAPELYEVLVMVRDADEDCRRDGLQTIPQAALARIDAALAKAEGRS